MKLDLPHFSFSFNLVHKYMYMYTEVMAGNMYTARAYCLRVRVGLHVYRARILFASASWSAHIYVGIECRIAKYIGYYSFTTAIYSDSKFCAAGYYIILYSTLDFTQLGVYIIYLPVGNIYSHTCLY